MNQAVAVRRDGDTYQARQFWLRAARLLDPQSAIQRVGFENGPKSFDDIWVEYAPGREPSDHAGVPLKREHLQCKWHVSPGTYGFSDLVEPAFINANARSLLQRAHDTQLLHAPKGTGARFKLVTNWQLDRADALCQMISNRSGAMRLDRLYGSKTDNSKAGSVRKTWREHLAIDENELGILANTLAFGHTSESLDDLRERLDTLFGLVGLQRVPIAQSAFVYDDVVFQWMAQGRLEFDRKSFQQACAREGLLGDTKDIPRVYGVKSFEHAFDRLEDRCDDVLDFVPIFDDRFIRDDSDWADSLYPNLRTFLHAAAKDEPHLRLALDAHTTLSFAAGSVLNVKSGRNVELEQRTHGRKIWAADDVAVDPDWPMLHETSIEIDPNGNDVAVALGITHDISDDVQRFIKAQLPTVGELLVLKPEGGPSAQVVTSGRHAFDLAQSAKEFIRKMKQGRAPGAVAHIFIAAPNALTFFLGQQQLVLGSVCLYEFDFESARTASYKLSLKFPVKDPTQSANLE